MTTLHITVGDRDTLREEAFEFVHSGDADALDASDSRAVLQFGSYDDLTENLTPLRLELLRTIASEGPESIREAARQVDRDVSDVHSDLKRLEVLGILTFEEGGPSGAMRPVVPFDRIEMRVDYPLVDESEPTDGAASV